MARYSDEPMGQKPKDWSKTQAYKTLRKDMLDDLDARGLVGSQFRDKVDEYMSLWCVLQQLKADIMEHGVTLSYKNGANQFGITDNKSVAAITRVSAQMLQIWTALGFRSQATAANAPPAQDAEEDEL